LSESAQKLSSQDKGKTHCYPLTEHNTFLKMTQSAGTRMIYSFHLSSSYKWDMRTHCKFASLQQVITSI